MKITAFFVVCILSGTFAFAQKSENILAQVGAKKITLEEFNKKYNDVKAQTMNPPSKKDFLEDLVRYEVGLQEAAKLKLENDPTVQDRMNQELYKAFVEKEIGQKVQKTQVTDVEMVAWYKKNPELRTSHILIEVKPGATPEQFAEAKKRALEIYEEVKKSKRPFEELVKLYSDDPLSKQVGGDVGWQTRVNLVPSYYDTSLSMKIGEIKGLIETPFGLHIIKLTGKHSYEESNKRAIRMAVFDEKRKNIFNDLFEKTKKTYSIKVNDSLIK